MGRRFAIPCVVLLVLGAWCLAIAPGLAAQPGLPATPQPAECDEPLPTMDELLARLGATPVPAPTGPASPATPVSFELPAGEPAHALAVAALAAIMRELVACANAGHPLYDIPFYTEGCLARRQAAEPISGEWVEFVEAWLGLRPMPAVDPDRYVVLLGVREARVLPGGRVGALVDWLRLLGVTIPAEPQVDFVYFAQQDGRWLIDGVVEDLEGRYPPPAAPGPPTPAPDDPAWDEPALVWCPPDRV